MSRQHDQASEDRRHRLRQEAGKAADEGLQGAVERMGGDLLGLSVKWTGYDCLLTLRAEFPAGRMVCFVGSGGLAQCLVKACSEAKIDGLKWRADKFT